MEFTVSSEVNTAGNMLKALRLVQLLAILAFGFTPFQTIAQEISPTALSLVITAGFVKTSFAAQFDAPYNRITEKNAVAWTEEDKTIDAKLATRRRSLAKSPT